MLATLLYAGAIFAAVWGLGILVSSRPFRDRASLVIMLLLAALWQASGAVVFSGGRIGGWYLPPLLLLGPVMFRFYRGLLLDREVNWSELRVHLIPAFLLAILLVARGAGLFQAGHWFDALAAASPKLTVLIYLSVIATGFVRAVIKEPPSIHRRILFGQLLLVYCILAIGTLGFLLNQDSLRATSAGGLPVLIFLTFIFAESWPDLFTELGRSMRRYSRSRLRGLDTDRVARRLEVLMKTERAFADEDMSLARLAAEVNLSTHQMSEYLNAVAGKSFSDYINDLRVDAAREMLLGEPERSTLSIAHAVGFNSRSAFYRAFRRRTGTDPSRLRARTRPES